MSDTDNGEPTESPEAKRHWAEMNALRIAVHRSLADAELAIGEAVDGVRQLDSGADVEYEGGGRFQQYLLETQRLLIITRALMPTDADGGPNTNPQLVATVRALMSGSYLQ